MQDELRKKLFYRSTHRGCKELDTMIGDFAKDSLNLFSPQELLLYEQLLNVDDIALYNWIMQKESPPPEYQTSILELLISKYSGS
jgi:antitoxin CptB